MSSYDKLTDLQRQEYMDMTKHFSPINPNYKMDHHNFYGLILSIDRIATETFKKMWKSHKEELIEEHNIRIAIEESKKNVVVDNKEDEEDEDEEEDEEEEKEEYISHEEYDKLVKENKKLTEDLEEFRREKCEAVGIIDDLNEKIDILEKEQERLLECRAKYRIEVYELKNLVEKLIKEKKKN